jgi:ACS family hexuronate transporter-like MFS transporter
MNDLDRQIGGKPSARYQAGMVALLSLNFGILFFDRNALNFLMPFVVPDLHLTNTQVGLTASALSFTWALSGFLLGAASDRSGRRKAYLVGATFAFSICSFFSGFATTFLVLLGSRLLMGVAEGSVLPISQSMTAASVSPERRGLAMGIMQNFGSNLFGSFFAPVLLVAFATSFGWHDAFFIAGAPGLLSAFLLWWFIREPAALRVGAAAPVHAKASIGEIFGHRNMILCAIIAVLLVAYLVICWAFMPLFLTQMRGFSPTEMGWLMGTLGISSTIGSFVVPGISDRIGRKPVMIAVPLLGVILPLGAIYYTGSAWGLAGIFFVGWALNGVFPMFMGTIPSETVNPRHVATALGIVMGCGEVLGGAFSPTIAGWAADVAGLAAPLWIMAGSCVAAGCLGFGLEETAPRKLKRSGSSVPAESFS